jgi:hypothetical protein
MKRISARWFARVSLIITVAVAGMPLAAHAAPEVVAWVWQNESGQANVPSGMSNVVAIAAGDYHSLALTAEGGMVAWGSNGWGETNVPGGLSNAVGIAAGGSHSLALLRQPTVPTPRLELSRGFPACCCARPVCQERGCRQNPSLLPTACIGFALPTRPNPPSSSVSLGNESGARDCEN